MDMFKVIFTIVMAFVLVLLVGVMPLGYAGRLLLGVLILVVISFFLYSSH